MTQKWVGTLVAITVLLTAVWSGVAAPAGTTQKDTFDQPVDDRWVLQRGNVSFANELGPANDLLTWMILSDDDDAGGTGASRVVANASHLDSGAPYWDTTRESYTWSATLVRNASYAPENTTLNSTALTLDGMIGITFGEQPGAGYYVAAFAPDRFVLGVPDPSNGEFEVIIDQAHWGDVSPSKMNLSERHKYQIAVDQGNVSVYVDNAHLGTFAINGSTVGTYGVIAGEDEQVKVGETHWAIFDATPPSVDLWRPESGSLYVHDTEIPYQIGRTIYVHGELTLVAEIADAGAGALMAHAYVDGDYRTSFFGNQTEFQESSFTIDTSDLSPGYHTVMVRAFDKVGNWHEERVKIYVISAQLPSSKTIGDTADAAVESLPTLPLP